MRRRSEALGHPPSPPPICGSCPETNCSSSPTPPPNRRSTPRSSEAVVPAAGARGSAGRATAGGPAATPVPSAPTGSRWARSSSAGARPRPTTAPRRNVSRPGLHPPSTTPVVPGTTVAAVRGCESAPVVGGVRGEDLRRRATGVQTARPATRLRARGAARRGARGEGRGPAGPSRRTCVSRDESLRRPPAHSDCSSRTRARNMRQRLSFSCTSVADWAIRSAARSNSSEAE